ARHLPQPSPVPQGKRRAETVGNRVTHPIVVRRAAAEEIGTFEEVYRATHGNRASYLWQARSPVTRQGKHGARIVEGAGQGRPGFTGLPGRDPQGVGVTGRIRSSLRRESALCWNSTRGPEDAP